MVDEKYVKLLQDAECQPVTNVPVGTDEPAVTIRALGHTLYALLATLTTGRSLRLVQRVPDRNGFEVWRQMVVENAPKTAGPRFAMLQAVLQSGMSDNPAQKLRDHLLVNSQQFESNYNKLRAIIQACLNTNKTWIVNDVRETDPMDVDHIGKSKGKDKGKSKDNRKGHSKGGSKGKGSGKPDNDAECYVC